MQTHFEMFVPKVANVVEDGEQSNYLEFIILQLAEIEERREGFASARE